MPKLVYLPLVLLLAVGAARAREQDVREAIVKIYTVRDTPNYYNPWDMKGAHGSTGSGCILEGNRILTNGHVVHDQTFIQVRRYGESKRYVARVVQVAHEVDLALLTVEDDSFFEGVEPLQLGELPESQSEVMVFGFPQGGDTLSTTKGVVSRIEHQTYAHSSCYFLAGQIDAAINPGNSGGPVTDGEKIVGVVMQSLRQADGIGYMVPVTLVQHVLKDLEDGTFNGFPSLGAVMQPMENPDIRTMYGMAEEQTGMLINRILPGSPAENHLQIGDVLLSIDGQTIANDGTVEFRPKERTSVSYQIQAHQLGDAMNLEVLRDGGVKELTVHLNRPLQEDRLIPMDQFDRLPSYYVYGGLVFCPLTKNVLEAWGNNWPNAAPKELVAMLSSNYPSATNEEVVLLQRVLADDVNEGYHSVAYWVVKEVNGKKILNLKELIREVESDSDSPFVVFKDSHERQVVLDRKKVAARERKTLDTYHVDYDRSRDLR